MFFGGLAMAHFSRRIRHQHGQLALHDMVFADKATAAPTDHAGGQDVGATGRVSTPPYPSAWRAGCTLAILLCAYVLSFIDRQIMTLMVGPIRADLHISDFQMGLLHGLAFALFYCFLGIPIGYQADTRCRKYIIAIGISVWSFMTALCGLAHTYGLLFLARMGVGVGEASLSPAAYSLLADSYRPERLARAMAIYTMGISIGSGIAYIVGGSVVTAVMHAGPQILPWIGEVRPWQMAFFIVGIPGLIIAAITLSLREPARQGIAVGAGKATAPELKTVLRYLRTRWRRYLPIYLVNAFFAIVGYGAFGWYPTLLIRNYAMTAGGVGLYFGVLVLVLGTLGTFCGALFTEWLGRRGYRDAHLRAVMLIALAALVPAGLVPLMPNALMAFCLLAPAIFLLSSYFGLSITALQLVTPNQMRAVNSSLLLFVSNLVGLGFGTPLVGLITDHVFGSDSALRYSMLMVTAVFLPLAALSAAAGLRTYRAGLDEAAAVQAQQKI